MSKTFEMPPALVLLPVILVIAAIGTLVLPQGEFERTERNFPNWIRYDVLAGDTPESISQRLGTGVLAISDLRSIDGKSAIGSLVPGESVLVPVGGMIRRAVVPDSYQAVTPVADDSFLTSLRRTVGQVATAPILGFVDKAQIIGFIVLLGGSFGIILSTGAIDQGLAWTVLKLGRGKARWAVIPVSFTLFSLGGAVFGMGECTIAFVLITVPLSLRLGYDTITGVAMCYMASQVGFAGAFFNPFTVGIAQGIAELPYLSGLEFRYVVWAIVTSIGIAFSMVWAARVEKDPTRSPTYAMDEAQRLALAATSSTEVSVPTWGQRAVIATALGSVFASGWGVAQWGWYIDEMAALFVIASLFCGWFANMPPREMAQRFAGGAATMVEPALIIACSAGIVIVLQKGMVLDTILQSLATPLESLSPGFGAILLMMVQACLNFFVPSGSGQAAMTMPLVTPLCDLIGLHRQAGVLAFQFGDGFGNLIVPTSAVLMGVLGAAKISWGTWIRWVTPLVIVLHIVGAIALVVATRCPASWLN